MLPVAVAIDRDKVLEAAQSHADKKRYDKAIVEYQKVMAADPKDARTLQKIGELYLKMERYESAAATFEQVAQLHAGAGFALKAIAAYKQAREIVQRYVPHLGERFGHLMFRVAELYVQLKLASDAIVAYEEIAARFEAAGRVRDAIDVLKKIVELDPQNLERAGRLTDALVRVGDVDAAVARLGAAADTLVARGLRNEAVALAERALELRPDPRLARMAVEIYLDRDWPNDAAAALLKVQICYQHAPRDLHTLGLLARTLTTLRQPQRALEIHKEAARVAREVGDMDAFDLHMETLVARAPTDEDVRKLAAQWSKAPRGMFEAQAPKKLPVPPPRAPPPPPPVAVAPPPPPIAAAPPPPPIAAAPPPPPPPPLRMAPPARSPLPPQPPPARSPLPPQPPPAAFAPPPFEIEPLELEPEPPSAPEPEAPVAFTPVSTTPPSFEGRGGFDEEAIEEVEFFVSQRMFEDALGILDEQLERLPDHPLLLDRRRDVEAMAAAAAAGESIEPWVR
jgi:tetratricopeptide (TPR) repeat protein